MRELIEPTISVSSAYQAATELCFSVPTSLLLQDFPRAAPPMLLQWNKLLNLHVCQHRIQTLPFLWWRWSQYPNRCGGPQHLGLLWPCPFHATSAPMIALSFFNAGAFGSSDTNICTATDAACGTGMLGIDGTTFFRGMDSCHVLGNG